MLDKRDSIPSLLLEMSSKYKIKIYYNGRPADPIRLRILYGCWLDSELESVYIGKDYQQKIHFMYHFPWRESLRRKEINEGFSVTKSESRPWNAAAFSARVPLDFPLSALSNGSIIFSHYFHFKLTLKWRLWDWRETSRVYVTDNS